MNKKMNLNGIGLMAVILGFSAVPQANAQHDYRGQMQSVQMQTISNLNNQRAQIETKISSAFASGQIGSSQATSLRAQLNQNSSLQNTYLADGVIDVGETQAVMNALNGIDSGLGSQIQAFITSNAAAPIGSNRFGNNNNSFHHNNDRFSNRFNPQFAAQMTNITNTQTRISTQLDSGRSNGTLTRSEYRALKSDLTDIESRTGRLADSRGRRVNIGEQQIIVNQLNDLQARVNLEIRDADRNVAGRNGSRRWW